MDYSVVAELVAHLRAADIADDVACVLINAAGSVFSAGADLREFQEELGQSASDFYESGAVWEDLFTFVPTMGIPIVVEIDGAARAGATGLVALADFVVASDKATFGLSEIKIGLFPIMVLPMIIRVIGYRRALDLALTGRIVDAKEAAEIGLVTRVVEPDRVHEAAAALAEELASNPPVAMSYGRRLLAQLADMRYDDAVHHARTMRGVFMHGEEIGEGVSAFLEKRKPAWQEGGI